MTNLPDVLQPRARTTQERSNHLSNSAREVDGATPAVEFSGVQKKFGETQALASLDLVVKPGEFIAIIGPSGCGKTTMLRLLAGLEEPDEGEIRIAGTSMRGVKPWRRKAPMVWQNYALFPFMSVRKNVEFALRAMKVPKNERAERAMASMRQLGIDRFSERRIDQLSGGQRQRVAIARALVQKPTLLLLDEPLSALDAHLRVQMQSELRQMHRMLGITFFYVTHYQSEALSMADRIVVMHEGRISQIGTPEEIYRQPANRFVAEFVGANNVLNGVVDEVLGDTVIVKSEFNKYYVPLPVGRELTAGQSVDFAIGADRANFAGGEPVDDGLSVMGTMRGHDFVGGTISHHVELDDGSLFRLDVTAAHASKAGPELGERVRIQWSPKDAIVLGNF